MVTLEDFSVEMCSVYDFFVKQRPSTAVMYEWHKQLRQFDLTQIQHGCELLKDTLDRLPNNVNIIKMLRDIINDDTQSNIINHFDYGECSSCNKTGIICVLYKNKELNAIYQTIFFCADCTNYQNETNDPSAPKLSMREPNLYDIFAQQGNEFLGIKRGDEVLFSTLQSEPIDLRQTHLSKSLVLMR